MPYQQKSREEGEKLSAERRAQRVEKLKLSVSEMMSTDFARGRNLITFEIGCGKGHFLSAYAENFKDELCVGVDLISSRIRDSRNKVARMGLQNAFFEKAEAGEYLDALGGGILCEKIFIMFPDPWPKKRHFKRRLIQTDFLNMLASHCASGARLYFRTDHDGYFQWARELIGNNENWRILPGEDLPFEAVSQFQRILPVFNTLCCQLIEK